MRRIRQAFVLGIVVLALAGSALAATLVSPVRPTESLPRIVRLSVAGQQALDLDVSALSALRASRGSVEIDAFPISPVSSGRLLLSRFEVAAPEARITITGAEGESSRPLPSVAHFSGTIEGQPGSRVYVGVSDGRFVAYLRGGADGSAYVGLDETNSDYVVRSSDSPINERYTAAPFTCDTEGLPAPLTANAEPTYPMKLAPLSGLKQAAVRVETDHQLYVHFSSDPNAVASYALTLFGAINTVYENELSLHLAIAEVHVWTVADPYVGPDTLSQLMQLGDWWHANRPPATYPRAFVHYLSGHPVSGGIAWIGVLCSGDFSYGSDWGGGYGLTQVYGTYPLQQWDQYASAHEMGHNAGSPHTHCMGPPTYPDWTDKCYNGESGCFNGTVQNPGAGNGTIMSYCHLLGWQYVSMVFHSRCINDKMLPEIAAASCLTQASTFIDVPPEHPYYSYVESLAAAGVTAGCGGSYYCPDASVTRAQMAVFLLKSKYGSAHVPPPATGGVFDDVQPGDFAADWIEELSGLGITAGCTQTSYCPDATVTRDQMAVFLLKSLYGSAHVPPAAGSAFSDVSSGNPFEPWIMELYGLGITGGCATGPLRYCPTNPNSRGEMAVFLVKTFNIP